MSAGYHEKKFKINFWVLGLVKKESEECIFWNAFSLSYPPAFASQIIMEKHSYTDKAPILRCAVNTRLFRIKRQLQVALMYNSSPGN